MIEAGIRNENNGRYLTFKLPGGGCTMEKGMIGAVNDEAILKPSACGDETTLELSYNITDCMNLEEYLKGRKLSEAETVRFMIALSNAADTLSKYLLGTENLILDERYIFVDKIDEEYRFLAMPCSNEIAGDEKDNGLLRIARFILINTDEEDIQALRLAVLIYKEACKKGCMIYDFMNSIIANRKDNTIKEAPAKYNLQETGPKADSGYKSALSIEDLDNYDFNTGISHENTEEYGSMPEEINKESAEETDGFMDYGYTDKEADNKNEDEESGKDNKALIKTVIIKTLISQAFLAAAAVLLFVLKGKNLVIRMLPVYLIFSVCMAAYFVIGAIAANKNGTE